MPDSFNLPNKVKIEAGRQFAIKASNGEIYRFPANWFDLATPNDLDHWGIVKVQQLVVDAAPASEAIDNQ